MSGVDYIGTVLLGSLLPQGGHQCLKPNPGPFKANGSVLFRQTAHRDLKLFHSHPPMGEQQVMRAQHVSPTLKFSCQRKSNGSCCVFRYCGVNTLTSFIRLLQSVYVHTAALRFLLYSEDSLKHGWKQYFSLCLFKVRCKKSGWNLSYSIRMHL